MTEYQPNSKKYKEEVKKKKNIEKVVSGKATLKKKNEVQKLAGAFIAEDVADVKTYILMDVLVPTIKKAISDIVSNGINMILYGEKGVENRKRKSTSKISYEDFYSDKRSPVRTVKSQYNFDNVILGNRGDAENVLACMDDLISEYKMASVADLYQLVGISCEYTDHNYGWTDITKAYVDPIRDGYLIRMPRVEKLK